MLAILKSSRRLDENHTHREARDLYQATKRALGLEKRTKKKLLRMKLMDGNINKYKRYAREKYAII